MITRTIAGLTIGQRIQLERLAAMSVTQSARCAPSVPGQQTSTFDDAELFGDGDDFRPVFACSPAD
jgi:hypothetical protein